MIIRLFFAIILVVPITASAENFYVDPGGVESGATWSGVDGASYTSTDIDFPGAGLGYSTLQAVVWGTDGTDYAMSPGDKVYLRGRTYTEDWGRTSDPQAQMQLPPVLNGSSWDEGNYNYIGSYPGEWAILSFSILRRFGIGYGDLSTPELYQHLKYWKFERLEITGASDGGIAICGGPIVVRYCYIHSNGLGTAGDTNKGGIHARLLNRSTIEYNVFENNSGSDSDNKTHIIIYGDYVGDIGVNPEQNTIRYNSFVPGANPANRIYKNKGGSHWNADGSRAGGFDAAPTSELITANKHRGEKIHHNIFNNTGGSRPLEIAIEYSQVYQNIVFGGGDFGSDRGGSNYPPIYNTTMYNNTLIGENTRLWTDATYGTGYWGYVAIQPNFWAVNNISDGVSSSYDSAIFGVMQKMRDYTAGDKAGDMNWAGTKIDRNLVHNPGDSYHFGLGSSSESVGGWLTTSAFNTLKSTQNYTNTASGLFGTVEGEQYIADPDFVVGSTTVEFGGLGGDHPYLDNVTIPAFLGATKPGDNDWVDGVLDMDVTFFTAATAGSDPTWIEGSAITTTYDWCLDADGDDYYTGSCVNQETDPGTGWELLSSLTGGSDCNDSAIGINPGATDICGNGIAEDCVADVACPVTGTTTVYSLTNGEVTRYKLTTEQ